MLDTQEPKYQAQVMGDNETRLVNRRTMQAIPDDEPIFIFRARDKHAVAVLEHYAAMCTMPDHQDQVYTRAEQFKQFALDHSDRMAEPGTPRNRS